MTLTNDLTALGWTAELAEAFARLGESAWLPGRVTLEHQHLYTVAGAGGGRLARVSGRFRHRARFKRDFPAVGDWVAVEVAPDGSATIHAVLPRRSRFSRRGAGQDADEQIVAANVDVVFLVSGLDRDFNLRRIERYLLTAREGGALPVVVLNKIDLVGDVSEPAAQVRALDPDVSIVAVSALTGVGLEHLAALVGPGVTAAFLGSSGVGKSTLINALLGEAVQRTQEVRSVDQRGRHTTTNRELIRVPAGGVLIDTPGMRELQLWEGSAAIGSVFEEIEQAAAGCRFRDCRHGGEPGCAVVAAVEAGEISVARLEQYHRLQRELAHVAAERDERAAAEERRRARVAGRAYRAHKPKR